MSRAIELTVKALLIWLGGSAVGTVLGLAASLL
jgi:hypothetical protein